MEKKICKCCGKEYNTLFSWENLCYSCQIEKEKDDISQAIRDGDENVDTGSSHWVFCPYCGEPMSTEWGYCDFPELYIEGDHMVECPECEKTFILESSCSWYYETRKVENE